MRWCGALVWLVGCGGVGIETEEGLNSSFRVEPLEVVQYAPTVVGQETSRELVITNLSDDTVTLSALEVSGTAADVFTMDPDPTPVRLQPAQKISLDVLYQPDSIGNDLALLTLVFEAGGEVEVERRLVGQGVGARNR